MNKNLLPLKKLQKTEVIYDFQLVSEAWQERIQVENCFSLRLSSKDYLKKVEKHFPVFENIQMLSLSKVSFIPASINHFKNLQILQIDSLESEFIPDVFDNFKNLKVLQISFHSQMLECLPDSFYRNCNNLEKLYLSDFKFIDLEKIFLLARSLTELTLIDSRFGVIPDNIKLAKNLKNIYFSGNDINDLPENLFSLNALESLYIKENKLSFISKKISLLKNLKILSLTKNEITEIPVEILSELQELTTLDLNFNRIKNIVITNEIDFNSSSLKSISISYNQIEKFPYFLLQKFPKLREIYLAGNLIQSFTESNILSRRMERIVLDENKIEIFPIFILEGLKAIDFLHLRKNRIKVLPKNLYSLLAIKKTKVLLEDNYIKFIEEEIEKHLEKVESYDVKISLDRNPVLERIKNENKNRYLEQREKQEKDKTCIKIGDTAYEGTGVSPDAHPLNNKISFTKNCKKCDANKIHILYASFSVHLHSGDKYWDYTYKCLACGCNEKSSYAEND